MPKRDRISLKKEKETKNSELSFFALLPQEIIEYIFSFLSLQDLVMTRQLNKVIEKLATQSKGLWQTLILRHFPYLKITRSKEFKESPYALYKQVYSERCSIECKNLNIDSNEWLKILEKGLSEENNPRHHIVFAASCGHSQVCESLTVDELKLAFLWAVKNGNLPAVSELLQKIELMGSEKSTGLMDGSLLPLSFLLKNQVFIEEKSKIKIPKNAGGFSSYHSAPTAGPHFYYGFFDLTARGHLEHYAKRYFSEAFVIAAEYGQDETLLYFIKHFKEKLNDVEVKHALSAAVNNAHENTTKILLENFRDTYTEAEKAKVATIAHEKGLHSLVSALVCELGVANMLLAIPAASNKMTISSLVLSQTAANTWNYLTTTAALYLPAFTAPSMDKASALDTTQQSNTSKNMTNTKREEEDEGTQKESNNQPTDESLPAKKRPKGQ